MKHLYLFIFLICSFQLKSQIYGNTDVPDYGSYGASQIVWFKIITGPEDTGFFTHYGIYDNPTQGNTCEIKFSIYDQHPTFTNRPSNKLVEDFLASPVNGVWNEVPVDPQIEIEPNTIYWIGLRFNCSYGSGRDAATVWANQPLRYYETWSFFSSWPDPVGSSPSTFGNVNNVGLYLVGNNMTLPVELAEFDVYKKGGTSKLEWATSSEVNNEGWNVQRSENGFSWKTIGRVEGNINSTTNNHYNYTDNEAPASLLFYRLEQVDLDGQKAYSEVKSVDMYQSKIKVYPTIVQDYITVEGIDDISQYEVHSINQEKLLTGTISNFEKIDLSTLSSGMYYITVNNEAFKIVKE